MGNWKNWCRLCGDSENACTPLNNCGSDGNTLLDNVKKYLVVVELNESTELPTSICKNCDKHLMSMCRFVQKCVKVQKMFQVLLDANTSNGDTIRDSYFKENEEISEESQNEDAEEELRNYASDTPKTKVTKERKAKTTGRKKAVKGIPKLRLKTSTKSKAKPKNKTEKKTNKGKGRAKKRNISYEEDSLSEDNDFEQALDSPDFYDAPMFKTSDHQENIENDFPNDLIDEAIPEIDMKDIKVKKEKSLNGELRRRRKQGEQIPPLGRYDCHSCDAVFKTWTQLSHHCSQEHKAAAHIICPGCSAKLTSRVMVSRHRAIHSGIPVETFSCDKCQKQFLRKSLLQDHILSHVPKEEQPFVCCKCARRFHSEALLRHHERVHLPPEDRATYPCPSCDKRFSSRSAVTAHMKAVHLGEKPFVCHECGQSFASKGILQEHLTIHSEDCPWKCHICVKKFKTKYRLKLHLDTHGETPYACPHCPMKLNTRRTLRMHLVVHRDTKAYQCQTCGKSFRRSKDLKNHNNLHTGKRPYTCPWCNRTFANGSNCRSHKRRMHPEELKVYETTLGIVHKERRKQEVSPVHNMENIEDAGAGGGGGEAEEGGGTREEARVNTSDGNGVPSHDPNASNSMGVISVVHQGGEEEEVDKVIQEDKINQQLLKLSRIYNHQQQHHHQPPTTGQQNYYQQFNFLPEATPAHFYEQHTNDPQEFPATIPAFPGNPYIHNLMYNRSNTHNM